MSFTRTKDRIWSGYDIVAAWLARQPAPVRRLGYGVFGVVLWTAYCLPGNKVRPTFEALARQVGRPAPRHLFGEYVRGFLRGIGRVEQVRHGMTDAVDAMLRIPDEARLRALLARGGVILAIPHTHASLAMGRGLARRHPILAIVRSTANPKRAASEWEIYENLGCEFLDIRLAPPTIVARRILAALKEGRLVVGTVDRIHNAPPEDDPVNAAWDKVRAHAFGEPIGIAGWPARFGLKAGATILPATVVQTDDEISLVLGEEVTPGDDLVQTTQAWVDSLEALFRAHPEEWTFALDKFWSQVLRNSVRR